MSSPHPSNREGHPLSWETRLNGRLPILALLALCLLVGLLVLPDYGASWDEPNLRLYAAAALKAYSPVARLEPDFSIADTYGPTNHRYYGPAYLIAANLLVNVLRSNPFGWSVDNLWHLASFLIFLAGGYALWGLCRRIVSPAAALAAALLYLTQPLLWGHALINPKDIPFMTSFLITITSGLAMVDHADRILPSVEPGGAKIVVKSSSWILAAVLCLYLFLFLCLIAQPLQSLLRLAIAAAQNSPAGPLGQLFYRFASSAAVIPAEDYVQKVMRWVNVLRWGAALLGIFSLLLAALARSLTGIRAQLLVFRSPRVRLLLLLAAAALGLSTSIRLLGPLAGLMVCAVALVRLRARAVVLLAAYGLAAMGVCLLSWPFLWADPIRNFSAALSVMTNFPDPFPVRFFGQFYLAQDLPPSFIPVIMAITLTEPAVLLTLAGLALAVWQLFRRGKDRAVITLLLCYLLLPIAAWMIWRPPLYDNGRQYLFVFPAAFAFCGLAIEALFTALPKWVRAGNSLPRLIPLILTVLAILPGLAAGAKIHPYQYVYYNAFVGGQAGAFRRFEVDYWLTSYKEAARYLNASAPQGASIIVFGSVPQLQMYTDPSFRIQKYQQGSVYDADFALLATRSDVDLDLFPAGKLIYTVGREGAVYAVLKKLK